MLIDCKFVLQVLSLILFSLDPFRIIL
jgi:hypothetical protein